MRKYLISEIQRFHKEEGRVPGSVDMKVMYGYPGIDDFRDELGTWVKGVEAAGFRPKWKKLIGDEVCIICGTKKTGWWHISDEGRICKSCYQKQEYNENGKQNRDYMNGLLDINSATGFGFLCQRIVAKKLGLELKYDCNCTKGFGHIGFDLLQLDNENYGKIQVKGATLRIGAKNRLVWQFKLGDNLECDNYIMLAFTKDKSDVDKVWVIPSDRWIVAYKQSLTITRNPKMTGIIIREIIKYEVDVKPYNDAYHNMKKLDECDIFTRKD